MKGEYLIEKMNKKWWEYWELKDTENALPRDYSCEVIFSFVSGGKEK